MIKASYTCTIGNRSETFTYEGDLSIVSGVSVGEFFDGIKLVLHGK